MFRDWHKRGYDAPSPAVVKHAVLRRHNIDGATWIETGTAKGDSTAVIAEFAPRVVTIEPQADFHKAAQERFRDTPVVDARHGTSETVFPELLAELQGDVCFWLDGHYSGSITFQAESDTPIVLEMQTIEAHMPHLGRVAVLIDDIRCFDPSLPDYKDYPPLDDVVDWARRCGLKWSIEQDIFVAVSP